MDRKNKAFPLFAKSILVYLHNTKIYVYARFNFYRPMLQKVSFTTYVPPGFHTKSIMMQRTNHMAYSINKAIRKSTTCMRALWCKGKHLIFMPGNADDFACYFQFFYFVRLGEERFSGFGNLNPAFFFGKHERSKYGLLYV